MDASPINPTLSTIADVPVSAPASVATPLDKVPDFLLWDMYFGAYVLLGPDVVANALNRDDVIKTLWPLVEGRRYTSYLVRELEMAVAHPTKEFSEMDLAMQSPNLALAFSLDPNAMAWTSLSRIIAMNNPAYAHALPDWKPNFFRLYGNGAKRFIVGSATFQVDCMSEFDASAINKDLVARYLTNWTTNPVDGDVLQFVAGDAKTGRNTFFFEKGALITPKRIGDKVVVPFTTDDFPILHYDRVLPSNWLLQLGDNTIMDAKGNTRGLDDPQTPLFLKEVLGADDKYTFFRQDEVTWNIVCLDDAAGKLTDALEGEVYVEVSNREDGDERYLFCRSIVPTKKEESAIVQSFQSLTLSDANFSSQPVAQQQTGSPFSFNFGVPPSPVPEQQTIVPTQAVPFQMQNFGGDIADPFATGIPQASPQQQQQYQQPQYGAQPNAYQQPTSFDFSGFNAAPQQQYQQQAQYQQPQYQQNQFPGAPSFLNQFPQGPQMQAANTFNGNGLVVM